MDPKREAKRTIADAHNEAGTPESENLGFEYGYSHYDLRGQADESGDITEASMPTIRLQHLWGDDQVVMSFAITLPDGSAAYATRHLQAEPLADYLEEAARNLRQRDLGNYLADA